MRTATIRTTVWALLAAMTACGCGDSVIIARMVDMDYPWFLCGVVGSGAVSVYTDITSISGPAVPDTVWVIHACPEIPRRGFAEGAGSLDTFIVGDYHRLVLSTSNVYHTALQSWHDPAYYCRTVDRHTP